MNIDNIIIINEREVVNTSIQGYFKNLAIVAHFENSSLKTGKTFDPSGHETYESLSALEEKFPTTHSVYKLAKDVFAQKINIGMNKSQVEKVTVCQILTTDDDVETGLVRIGYADAYHWVLENNATDEDIESFFDYFADKRKLPHAQTSEPEVLTNGQITPEEGEPYDNIAKKLKDKNAKAVLYYHALSNESLAGAEASIYCNGVPGRISGVFDKPSGITIDVLTDNQQTNLNINHVNFFTNYIGHAGSYMTRTLTAGGFMSNGEETQQQEILDRIILNLQSAGMDALEMKIPYDDRGGTILEGKLRAVMKQLQNEQLLAEDSIAEDGTVDKGYTLEVLSRATVKREYASKFAEKCFVVKATAQIALNAKKVEINLVYEA